MTNDEVMVMGIKYIEPHSQFIDISFWCHGVELPYEEGWAAARLVTANSVAEQGGGFRTWLKK